MENISNAQKAVFEWTLNRLKFEIEENKNECILTQYNNKIWSISTLK